MEHSVNTKQQCQSLNHDDGSPDVLVIALFMEKGSDSVRIESVPVNTCCNFTTHMSMPT